MRDGIVGRQISRVPKDQRLFLAVAVMATAIGFLLRLPLGAQAPDPVQAVLERLLDTQQGSLQSSGDGLPNRSGSGGRAGSSGYV